MTGVSGAWGSGAVSAAAKQLRAAGLAAAPEMMNFVEEVAFSDLIVGCAATSSTFEWPAWLQQEPLRRGESVVWL